MRVHGIKVEDFDVWEQTGVLFGLEWDVFAFGLEWDVFAFVLEWIAFAFVLEWDVFSVFFVS
jgi:hypothetical protein